MSTQIAVSGHRIYDAAARDVIAAGVREVLAPFADDGGAHPGGRAHLVSSLAEGADQLAAEVALSLGLALDVVLPAPGYAESLLEAFRAPFAALLEQADAVRVLDFPEPTPEAYLAAGLAVLDGADLLLAIWDGAPARGVGGTAQVVAAARAAGTEVAVVWPHDYVRPR